MKIKVRFRRSVVQEVVREVEVDSLENTDQLEDILHDIDFSGTEKDSDTSYEILGACTRGLVVEGHPAGNFYIAVVCIEEITNAQLFDKIKAAARDFCVETQAGKATLAESGGDVCWATLFPEGNTDLAPYLRRHGLLDLVAVNHSADCMGNPLIFSVYERLYAHYE